MNRGRNICRQLKEIRRDIARDNGIELDIPECTYKGDCDGTCPQCEAELQHLEHELTMRTLMGKAAVVAGLTLGISGSTLTVAAQDVASDRQNHTKTISDTSPSKSDTCVFKGTVIESTNGEPLIGAPVILKDKKGNSITGARTDFDGNFTIRVPKGKYTVEFAYIGYNTQHITLNLNSDTLSIGAFALVQTGTMVGDIPVMITGIPMKTPLFEFGAPESGERIDADRIKHAP